MQGAAELLEAARKTPVAVGHLATLWALDADHDGKFSRQDAMSFFDKLLPQTDHCRDDELQVSPSLSNSENCCESMRRKRSVPRSCV